jgi:hypothetical protein
MNDDLMFDYLLQMGAMRPEQDELKRKQAMVDALRGNALKPMEGQMVGKHYVAPGLAGAISQLGQAYMAKNQQGGVDQSMQGMNARQAQMLEELRKRRSMGGMNQGMNTSPLPMVYGTSEGE